jgi:hypothetical protein
MLEKTGSLKLTQLELNEIQRGDIPFRIKNEWNLSLNEILDIIQSGQYQVIGQSVSKTETLD